MEPRATPWVTEAFTLLSVRQKQQRRPRHMGLLVVEITRASSRCKAFLLGRRACHARFPPRHRQPPTGGYTIQARTPL